jgi:copper chaperone NosL
MKTRSKIVIIIVSAALVVGFFLPIWGISLEAPQYPEGLGMSIWINKITGDLNTINGLNHYIGMKRIEPDSINELKLMPYILGFLAITGIITGLLGKKKLLTVWVIIFVVLGVAGGIDFYKWEYDYGHNLNPEAAIKIPGMSYQPPLLGTEQLLNFTATSLPDTGGVFVIASGIIGLGVLTLETFFNKTRKTNVPKHV